MPSAEYQLTREEAQSLAVIATGLDRRPFRRKPTAHDLLETIRKLGSVQLDTISVVSRSHETVLWSRLGPYDPALIQSLYDPGLAITEYLAHAAAIIPSESLHLFKSYMLKARREGTWSNEPENRQVMDRVLARIDVEGPSGSHHFDRPDDGRRAQQWEWYGLKPERRALDRLWVQGEIVLRRRDRGFSRVFDLPDRVIPGFWDTPPVSEDDRDRIFVRKAMSALGVGTARWVSDYFRTGGPGFVRLARTRQLLAELEASGEVVPVEVTGIEEPVWLDAALVERLEGLRAGRMRPVLTTLLSPFDNLIWNRDRALKLWNFHYRLECYTPEPKRLYGYYSLPILHRGRVVGRLDPSFDRKTRFLTVKALHLEPVARITSSLVDAIAGALDDLVLFLGGEPGSWVVRLANPPEIAPMLSATRARS
ncbi:MAG: winged helix DNA-binding domain-containing protein [Chloroflexota bacterium]|nr:winged helix DNA-binding domain-containing protein [Chloroflexota bacterium]